MQACRRRRRRAVHLGIHRIVAVFIRKLFLNIRGQRHRAYFIEDVLEHTVVVEFNHSLAAVRDIPNRERKPVTHRHRCADFSLFAGAHQHFPSVDVLTL